MAKTKKAKTGANAETGEQHAVDAAGGRSTLDGGGDDGSGETGGAETHFQRLHRAMAEENGQAVQCVSVELPLDVTVPATTWGIHIDVRLSAAQSLVLRRLAAVLDQQNVKLQNGRRATTPADALRWLLDEAHERRATRSGGA